MLKRLILKFLFRFRSFMNEEIQAELIDMRQERRRLNEALARLEKFDATAKAVEDGLLTLALTAKTQTSSMEHGPPSEPARKTT